MNVQSDTRSGWAKLALSLQGVAFLVMVWSSLNLLFLWPRYAQRAEHALILALVRSTVEAAAAGVAFWGLWRSKRWGWILAVLTEATLCLLTLSNLIQYPTVFLRNARWLAFSVWDFAAIAVLLHRPVREFFLEKRDLPQHMPAQGTVYGARANAYSGLAPQGAAAREINWPERCARVISYFLVAVIVACVVTAFSITLMMGTKAGGARGFLLFVYFGLLIGWGPSLLFAVLLTFAMRKIGPGRLGAWLLAGLLLAPGLTLGLGALASKSAAAQQGLPGYFFYGPLYLFQGWWLTIPVGLVTAFFCFQLFPWAFGKADGPARPLRMQN